MVVNVCKSLYYSYIVKCVIFIYIIICFNQNDINIYNYIIYFL